MRDEPAPSKLRDPARVEAVRRAGFGGPGSDALDRLTEYATRSLHVPMAAVTLVDATHQYFLSQRGFPQEIAQVRRTPVRDSFCRHVVLRGRAFHVTDALRDPFFFASPLVVEHAMRAYAGTPLLSAEGVVLGAFCVVDLEARTWSPLDLRALSHLGRLASIELARGLDTASPAGAV